MIIMIEEAQEEDYSILFNAISSGNVESVRRSLLPIIRKYESNQEDEERESLIKEVINTVPADAQHTLTSMIWGATKQGTNLSKYLQQKMFDTINFLPKEKQHIVAFNIWRTDFGEFSLKEQASQKIFSLIADSPKDQQYRMAMDILEGMSGGVDLIGGCFISNALEAIDFLPEHERYEATFSIMQMFSADDPRKQDVWDQAYHAIDLLPQPPQQYYALLDLCESIFEETPLTLKAKDRLRDINPTLKGPMNYKTFMEQIQKLSYI